MLLDIRNVSFEYQTKEASVPVLKDLTFSVQEGEFLSIVGPSGCGKSTLLNLFCGLLRPTTGCILFQEKPVNAVSAEIGYMLQKDHLLEWRSLIRNVLLGPEISGTLSQTVQQSAHNYLNKYELDPFSHARPSQLSGGMRQRAALIRTLMQNPSLLLLDEPFSALDYQTRLQVCDDIWSIIKAHQKTAILVTHDLAEAISTGDRVLILSSRPSTIVKILELDSSFCSLSPLACRESPEFNRYFKKVWEVMRTC